MAPRLRARPAMHANRFVILVALLSLAGCGATQAQRRNNASLAVAAGAALVVTGVLLAQTDDGDDCPDEEDLCLDLVNENKVLGGLMVLGGGGLAFGGLGAFVASALPSKPDEPAPMPIGDPAACLEWRRSLDAETDPARRGALHAARPVHCARPRPPSPASSASAEAGEEPAP